MDNARAADWRLLSRLLVGFGLFTLMSSIIGAFVFRALVIDVGALLVIWLGALLAGGSTRAAKWLRILMLLYFVGTALLFVLCIVAPHVIRIAGNPIRSGQLPYVLAYVAVGCLWALINLSLLLKHKSSFLPPATMNP